MNNVNSVSKVHEIDGIKYREVNRKAKVGDKVIVIGRLPEDTSDLGRQVEAKIGRIYTVTDSSFDSELANTDGKWRDGSRLNLANGEYNVLEPIVEVTANDASDRVLEMLANLAVRLTDLERKVSDLDSGYNALCTELSEIEETVEMALDDVVTLDGRMQPQSFTINVNINRDDASVDDIARTLAKAIAKGGR